MYHSAIINMVFWCGHKRFSIFYGFKGKGTHILIFPPSRDKFFISWYVVDSLPAFVNKPQKFSLKKIFRKQTERWHVFLLVANLRSNRTCHGRERMFEGMDFLCRWWEQYTPCDRYLFMCLNVLFSMIIFSVNKIKQWKSNVKVTYMHWKRILSVIKSDFVK